MKLNPIILFVLFNSLIFVSCANKDVFRNIKPYYSTTNIIKLAEQRFDYDWQKEQICDFYILDGVPYDQNGIDSVLKTYDKEDIRMITLNKNSQAQDSCNLIPEIQTTFTEQTSEYKKSVLNRVIKIYNRYYNQPKIRSGDCGERPLVIIWGKPIPKDDEVLEILTSLNLEKIDYIADYRDSQRIEIFGSICAKNGVVEIFLK